MSETRRRDRMDKMVPLELAIVAVRESVEAMPPHCRLTDAVNLLNGAQAAVADVVDTMPWMFAATPPTPDRAAVREALVYALETSVTWDKLARALGLDDNAALEDYADALLAAVSRPAEARREPSEAMVEACIAYDASTWKQDDTKWPEKALEQGREFYRGLLRAALAAREPKP